MKRLLAKVAMCALALGVCLAPTDAFALISDAEKGFVEVDNLKTDVTLHLADGKTVTLGEALPEYQPSWWGSPLAVGNLKLLGTLPRFAKALARFDLFKDDIIDKPEFAIACIVMAAKAKGIEVTALSVGGKAVNGLNLSASQEYGVEALIREVPARDPAAKAWVKLVRELELFLDEDLGGGGGGGGGAGGQ